MSNNVESAFHDATVSSLVVVIVQVECRPLHWKRDTNNARFCTEIFHENFFRALDRFSEHAHSTLKTMNFLLRAGV